VQQFLYSQLERLRSGSSDERRAAISALGAAGDDSCLPDLALCLRDPSLRDAAHAAMWAVFGRCRDPRVGELMAEAEPLLHGGTTPQLLQALEVYTRVVTLQPSFAEVRARLAAGGEGGGGLGGRGPAGGGRLRAAGVAASRLLVSSLAHAPRRPPPSQLLQGFNKRATVLYLLGRHADAIADCETVLSLNPYHFGAASGMGLCHWSLKETGPALAAFERALAIHPGLRVIEQHAQTLRDEELDRRRAQQQRQQQQQQQQPDEGSAA
jgi:tetratricopeptide (TPR) repeat protein